MLWSTQVMSVEFILLVASLLALSSCGPNWAGHSSSEVDEANKEELEQIFNRIFSGSREAPRDPETTRQWLRHLERMLERKDNQEEMYDKVKKLLAFDEDDPDCDLTKGSGEQLVAHHRFFRASNSTPTIRSFIASCLARLYEQCKESFVASTEAAAGRLSNSADYERMARLKELASAHTDLRSPVVQFLLEKMNKCPADETEFEGQFKRHISGPCKTVRREFHLMMYFEVLLTLEQIESMGESVVQWYKVNSVCKWALDDELRPMKALFKHMTLMVEREDMIIEKNYKRVFQPEPAWPSKPDETYERLVWLSNKLEMQCKRKHWDRQSVKRLSKVRMWLEMGQFWRNKQCDMGAVKQVNQYLFKDKTAYTYAIKTYLLHLGEQAFELCRSAMAEQVADSIQRLAWDPQWKRIFRLHELVAKIFDKTGRCGWSKFPNLLLGLVVEEHHQQQQQQPADAQPSPETMDRDEFNERINSVVLLPCQRICHEFHYFADVSYIWQLKSADEMDPTVRYWFLTFQACSDHHKFHTEDSIYARLFAKGTKRDQSSA